MKIQTDFTVISNTPLGENFARISLQTAAALPPIHPGQFVQVQIPSSIHGWLRIPISIHDADTQAGKVVLLVQKVGDGSRKIASLQPGATVNLVLPLGNGFMIGERTSGPFNRKTDLRSVIEKERTGTSVLLVGGGAGLAPLYYLAKQLRTQGVEFSVLIGARAAARLVLQKEFEQLAPTFVCTEDGSAGFKGLVTDHPVWSTDNRRTDLRSVYTCGPTPMMKAVAQKARKLNALCEVSLENNMACGLGACLCCVTPNAEGHNVCVCTEGPVFNIDTLGW